MKNIFTYFFIVISGLLIAQEECIEIDVTDSYGNSSLTLDCDYPLDENGCFTLEADYTPTYSTSSYEVSALPFINDIPIDAGTIVNENVSDDTWGTVIDLPFEFSFFGNVRNQIVIADNGVISFNTSYTGNSCVFSATSLPNTALYKNSIYVLYHDLTNDNSTLGCNDNPNTAINECGDIRITTLGAAPCRKFVVNYNHVNHFGCSEVTSSFQLLLYEGSNLIDINILEKPINCEPANPLSDYRKKATIGLLNADGTQAFFPAGRNASEFEIYEERYRFTPNGSEASSIVWTNNAGEVVGNTNILTICDWQSEVYTANLQLSNSLTLTDSFEVTLSEDFPLAEDITVVLCDENDDGQETLNLSDYYNLINSNYTHFTLTAYPTFTDAENQTNPISNTGAYDAINQSTIYIRVSFSDDCYQIGEMFFDFSSNILIEASDQAICDQDNDGMIEVDLTQYNEVFVANSESLNIQYYLSFEDAQSETNAYTTISITESTTVWIRVQTGECYNIESFTISLLSTPTVEDISIELCYGAVYDLSQHIDEIVSDPAQYSITYHIWENQAESGSVAINPERIINREAYYVRIEDPNTGCFSVAQITVNFIELEEIEDFVFILCDEDEDGSGTFDLNEAIAEMVGNIGDYSIEFYTSNSAAHNQNPNFQIVEPEISNYILDEPGRNIFVRFEHLELGCVQYAKIKLRLSVLPEPLTTEIYACFDPDENPDSEYILETFNSQLINTEIPNSSLVFIQWYESESDAENQINQITEYIITETTTLYIRMIVGKILRDENGDPVLDENENVVYEESCYGVFPIIIYLSEVEDIIEEPIDYCDNNNDGIEAINVSQFTTAYTENPDYSGFRYYKHNHSNLNSPYVTNFTENVTNFYFSFINEFSCRIEVEYTINLMEAPVVENENIVICDLGQDGEEEIDITHYFPDQYNNSLYTLSFHLNEEDAFNETNPITNLTNFTIDATQNILYLRVRNNETLCWSVAEYTFEFQGTPAIEDIIYICEENGNTSYENYNLSLFDTQLTEDSDSYTIGYYLSFNDADQGINEVINADIYDGQAWFIRMQSNLGCYYILETEISFFQIPELDTTISICDNNANQDETIILSELNDLIVSNNTGYEFTYYSTLEDLQTQSNGLADSETMVIDSETNLFVHIQYNHHCYDQTEVTIQFLPLVETEDYVAIGCDLDNNLEEVFDLTEYYEQLCSQYANYSIDIYTDEAAANNEDSSYLISQDPTQYLANQEFTDFFVRFENENTQCYSVAQLTLHVSPIPKLVNASITVCDIDFDGLYDLELATLNALILDEVEQIDLYSYSYHLSFDEAYNNQNPIQSEMYSSPLNEYSIFVRVENEVGCFSVSEAEVTQIEKVAVQPIEEEITLCDTLNDGIEPIDLSEYESLINEEVDSFEYYESFEDMSTEQNPITDPSHYITSQTETTLYIRVKKEGFCDNFTTLSIRLLESPESIHESIVYFCEGEEAILSVEDQNDAYYWYETGDETYTTTVSEEGIYEVLITAINGCTVTYFIEAKHYVNPEVLIEFTGINSISIQYDQFQENLEFSLNGMTYSSTTSIQNIMGGIQTLYIHNLNTDCYYAQEFYIAEFTNTITPNGDGVNDYWHLDDLYFFQEGQTRFQLFDRYGKMLQDIKSNTQLQWDGTYNGRNVPTGTYWYLLELADGRKFKGWIFVQNEKS